MVDGGFMVDGPWINHAEKAVNHVLWLTGLLGRWLTVGISILGYTHTWVYPYLGIPILGYTHTCPEGQVLAPGWHQNPITLLRRVI